MDHMKQRQQLKDLDNKISNTKSPEQKKGLEQKQKELRGRMHKHG